MKKTIVNKNFHTMSEGVHFFVPDDATAFASHKPTTGFGMIRYDEGSVYCGELYFDGERYNKLGRGRQEFLLSAISAPDGDGVRKAFYIGEFDYRETDWIYGNGVMYYVDAELKPKYYVKGFFEGTNKIGDCTAEVEIADGYTPDMERDISDWANVLDYMLKSYKNVKSLDTLFIGDSYLEFWHTVENTFYNNYDNAHFLNVGVGGTKFDNWNMMLLKKLNVASPRRIVINLGFNDIHSNRTASHVLADCKAVVEKLRNMFGSPEIFLLNIAKAPSMEKYYNEEQKYNAALAAAANELGVTVVDMRSEMENANNKENCFALDAMHLNSCGYVAFNKKIRQALSLSD